MSTQDYTVAIVGAGPIGIELAIVLKRLGISCVQFEKKQVGQMIYDYPPFLQFFSSNERISIAGIPIPSIDQQKSTREEYLAYLRMLIKGFDLQIHTYEEVWKINKHDKGFRVHTNSTHGPRDHSVRYVVLATGSTSKPRMLGVPGEDLPHVTHMLGDIHQYFNTKVLIVGGKNSAVEAALRCYHVGAKVTMVVRKPTFIEHEVKYWLLPELSGRISNGEIKCYFNSVVKEILPDRVVIRSNADGSQTEAPADFVITTIGFQAEMGLFENLGIPLNADSRAPEFNPETMETTVPGIYAAGTVTAGTQKTYKVFLENCHEHVEKIARDLCGKLGLNDRFEELYKTPLFSRTYVVKPPVALEE